MATKKQWYIVSMLYETEGGYNSAQNILHLAKDPGMSVQLNTDDEVELNYWFQATTSAEAAKEAAHIAEEYGQEVFTVYKAERAFTEEDIAG